MHRWGKQRIGKSMRNICVKTINIGFRRRFKWESVDKEGKYYIIDDVGVIDFD